MSTRRRMLLLAPVLALGLAGCGGGSNGGGGLSTFTQFVKDQFGFTSDRIDPAPVNNRNFRFSDLENPNAYDDLL